jgi:hypothetical protein
MEDPVVHRKTLGMLHMASGAARVVSNNSTITGLPQSFADFGNMIVLYTFPSIFLIAVASCRCSARASSSFGIGDNFKPIVIGAVVGDRFLRSLESR